MNGFYFVLFEQEANAACQFGHNTVFALNHFGSVKVVYSDVNTMLSKFSVGLVIILR